MSEHSEHQEVDQELEEHPDTKAEEELTALEIYRKKLKTALTQSDLEKVQHNLALVEHKVELIEKLDTSLLSAPVKENLAKEVEIAKNEIVQTEQILELARGLSKAVPSTSTAPEEPTFNRIKWNWSPMPFHGKKGEWPTWWQMFSAAVDEDTKIKPIHKMKALRECVKGEALNVIDKLGMSGDNYQTAIDMLTERFGNPLVLSQAYYEQLSEIPVSVDLKSQRQSLDKLIAINRHLQDLKEKVTVDQAFIITSIVRKFSIEFLRWVITPLAKKQPDMKFTPQQILDSMDLRMKVENWIDTQMSGDDVATTSVAPVKPVGVMVNATKRKAASAFDERNNCVFCEKSHASVNCRTYGTLVSRRNRLTELKRCHNCILLHHEAKDCRKSPAVCGRCRKSHHLVLCFNSAAKSAKQGKILRFRDSFLQTFICLIENSKTGKKFEIRGIFDPASHSSFISSDLLKKLNLSTGNKISLECSTFAESNVSKMDGYQVKVTVKNFENKSLTIEVITTPCITGHISTCPPPEDNLAILPSNLDYADYDIFKQVQRPLKLLIGADLYHSFVDVKRSRELSCGVNVLSTFFGWVPSGGIRENEPPIKKRRITLLTGTSSTDEFILGQVGNKISETNVFPPTDCSLCRELIITDFNIDVLWRLEVLGIENPQKEVEKGLEYCIDMYKKTTYVDELGRKNIRLPWKDLKVSLPSNFRVAFARLKQLVEKTPLDVLKVGDAHFKQQQEEGIIEDAPPLPKFGLGCSSDEKRKVHYLPHRWLFQKGKIRVVYDASAPTKAGICLNSTLYQGCNLTSNLVRLLINFRLFKVGLVSDIEKAFLQISLNEVDRDASHFLWLKDVTKPVTESNLAYKRFARLPMGLNVSPYILNMVLADTFNDPPVNKWLVNGQNRFYADNLVASVPTQTDALNLFEAMTDRLTSIKMNLRDWATNDKTIANALPPEKLDHNNGEISVLGLPWDRTLDILRIKVDDTTPLIGTKRNVLKFYASIFDPLGLVAPCVLDLKLLIQKCWKNCYEWDTLLPPQLTAEWLKLRTDALKISQIKIPRHYFDNSGLGHYELHVFCDASQKAYACCAYLVYINKVESTSFSNLIFSKIRISPPQGLTIPKLELLAVLIGKRSALFLKANLEVQVQKIVLWTDATTILQWLKSSEILSPFIQNRIAEIRQTDNIIIRYVRTEDNPADCASRGLSVQQLDKNKFWWHGPHWLQQERLWPQPPANVENFDSSIPRIQNIALVIGAQRSISLLTNNMENNVKVFKTWSSRVRIFYNVLKFCFLGSKQPFFATEIEATNVAERLLIIELQHKYFHKEIKKLKKGENPRTDLGLFLDDKGIIRCKGRLHYAKFPWETKNPVFLPRESPAVFGLIKEIHEKNEHIGVGHTLAKLRETYWISKGRAKVKSVLHACTKCRYWYGGSYPLPPIPPLPEARVADITPFLQTGIDSFGPLHIRTATEIVDVHVLIFTCLVTRAIHLELVPDLSGDQFLLALERFCCLKRVPKLIISDNAKAFVFVQPMIGIKVQIRDHKIDKFLMSNRVEWYFIPAYAPWFGGVYERLIGIIKKCLKISYGRALLTYMELQTVVYKIADILNSRPLTYVSDEVVEPLTPNHFLKLGPTNINLSLDPTPKPPFTATGQQLFQHWEVLNRILDSYWDAFRNVYLLALRDVYKSHHKEKKGVSSFLPRVGDIVLVQEVSMPRAYWKIGKIEKLDKRQAIGFVRCNKELLMRSIRHLYPLEVQREQKAP